MPTFMQLTKGATVIDLNGPLYHLVRWDAGTPRRSRAVLGGDGPYTEAEATVTLHIFGATESEATEAFHDLLTMLDDAEAFYDGIQNDGTSSTPVLWRVRTPGGAYVLTDMVLGPAGSGAPVQPPATWSKELNAFVISNVVLRFRRKGRLPRETEQTSTTSALADVGAVHSVTFPTAADVASPVRLTFGGGDFTSSTPTEIRLGMLLTGSASSTFTIIQAESMASGAFTSASDSGLLASGGNVLRYTPVATTRQTAANVVTSTPKKFMVILEVRNNSAGETYTVDVQVTAGGTPIRSAPEIVDDATLMPRLITLPPMSVPRPATSITIGVQADVTGGTLDIDRIILVDLGDPYASALIHGEANLISTITPSGSACELLVDHQYLTALDPLATVRGTSVVRTALFSSIESNPTINSVGTTLAAIWLCMDDTGTWAPDSGAGGRIQIELTAYRLLASLSPR